MKHLFRSICRSISLVWVGLLFSQFGLAQTGPLNLAWKPREDLNVLLPGSIQVYDTYSSLPNGNRIRAMYALVSVNDPNLKLRAVGDTKGAAFRLKTTKQVAEENRAIFAVNGGFFATNESVSLVIKDGELVAANIASIVRNNRTYFPTRSAFGIVNRKPDVAWIYTLTNGLTYQYPKPSPVDDTKPAPPRPTEISPDSSSLWNASQAVGGGPVLVQNGQVRLTSQEELFNDDAFVDVNPRTAIGYRDENTLIVLVVDGRQRASVGATLPQLAQIMQELGCKEAVNLDGGGSSTMIARDEVVNNPTNVDGGDRNNLRSNAAALVWSEDTETPTREVQTFDTDGPNYTEIGLWTRISQSSYYGTTAARGTAPGNGTKAIYRFNGLAAGRYQLGAWWTVSDNNAASVPYVLHRMNGRVDTIRVNQNDYGTVAKWNVLGYFELAAGDYLEIMGTATKGNRVIADAIRLVTMEKFPALPVRGDVRIAVVSDLNSDLGSATYEWQVDSIMQRIPRIWKPDLVLCGGDMVAGQGPITNQATIRSMWRGFDRSVLAPIRASNTPFGFTIGNHDGVRGTAYATERAITKEYWDTTRTNLPFVDKTNFPYYYSFRINDLFFASWDASSSTITDDNLNWLKTQLDSPGAKNARMRFLIGHLPLYSVAQERDAPGNILDKADELRSVLQEKNVHTYISGHHHAYFPGKRGSLELLNAGAAGSGPRQWLFLDRPATNTMTIMDIFYGKNGRKDTTVYTTYEIAYRDPADMPLFDYKTLPRIIYGYNGNFIVRRDAASPKLPDFSGRLSALHLEVGKPEVAVGGVDVKVIDRRLTLTGFFRNLEGTIARNPDAVGLYAGRNGDTGRLLSTLNVSAPDGRNGTFSLGVDNAPEELLEQVKAGGTFVQIKTNGSPNGEIRSQVYEAGNIPPSKTLVTNVNDRNVYAVRNLEAIFELNWSAATDAEGDAVTYFYQISADSTFSTILYQVGTGRVLSLKRTEADWYALLGNTPAGQSQTFYHRLVTSDGRNLTTGDFQRVRFTRSDAPLDELVEVPAPAYRFAGKLANAPNGYGATFDNSGRLWYVDYSVSGGAVYIENPDGTPAPFSPLVGTSLDGNSNNTGIGLDGDGNILLSRNSRLFKLDAKTGKIIASWQSPVRANGSANTLTVPQPSTTGEVYVPSLWNDDYLYVLRQAGETFRLVKHITLPGRILARSFAMEPDGKVIYLPNPGSAQVQKFVSTDGTTYELADNITSLAAGSSGIRVTDDKKVYLAVRASGVLPATIHFRDEASKRLWTLPLPDVGNIEARGLGVSRSGDTLIYCGWNGTGTYRYVRTKTTSPAVTQPPTNPTQLRSASPDEKTAAVVLYPNPVDGWLTIETDASVSAVTVTTMLGKVVVASFTPKPGRPLLLDVSSLPTGVYIVTLQTPDRPVSQRFMKR